MTEPLTPAIAEHDVTVYQGDVRAVLAQLPAESVNCVVTSPPYYGLRDYGCEGQIGLEASPAEYVETMRAVFADVRRVLRPDGVLWLNLGDSYYSGRGNPGPNSADEKQEARRGWVRALGRNPGDVWSIVTQPYAGAHFATMPRELVRRCILAGCPESGAVLDPFTGSGTTAMVARSLGRRFVGAELNPDYIDIIRQRIGQTPLNFGEVSA